MRRFRRRGFSVVEVIIAASLAVGLGMVVSVAIASSSSSSKDAITRADAAEEVRRLNDLVTRYVQAGVALPTCLEPTPPPEGLPFASCLVPGQNGQVLESASPDKIVFFSYPEGPVSGSNGPLPPEKVTVEVTRNTADGSVTLTVSSLSIPSSTNAYYVASSAYSGTAEVLRATTLVTPKVAAAVAACPSSTTTTVAAAGTSATNVFSFFDSNGVATTEAAKVSVIAFDPRVKVLVADEACPRTVSSPAFLTLPSQGFGR
jgi:hypothetical protein